MSLRIIRTGVDGRAELRDRALDVTCIEQAPSRAGSQNGCLMPSRFLPNLLTGAGLDSGSFIVTQRTQYGGKRGVSTREVRLQADGVAESVGTMSKCTVSFRD